MSKSLGNIIDPKDMLKKYGAEAIRFWSATEGDLAKQDLKVSEEKIKAETKTLTKIINIAKFVMQFEKPSKKPKLSPTDNLFIGYIEDLTKRTEKSYDEYNFHHPSLELRNFIWDIFSSNYLEIIKNRAYNEDKNFSDEESNSAKYSLHFIFERMLFLLYPIIPQITSTLAKEKSIDLSKEKFPNYSPAKSDLNLIEKLKDFNSLVWKTKKEKGISLREEIKEIKIPQDLTQFENDLKAAHKLI